MIVYNNAVANIVVDRGPWNRQNKSEGFPPYTVDDLYLTPNLHTGFFWVCFLMPFGCYHVMDDAKCKENCLFSENFI